MRFDVVFFDSGGTLYGKEGGSDPSPAEVRGGRFERVAAGLTTYGVDVGADEVCASLSSLETTRSEELGAAYNFFRLLIGYCERLGVGAEIAASLADSYAGPRYASWLFEGTIETIEALHRTGLPMGVVANTSWPGFCMDRAFSGVGLLPFFKAISGSLNEMKWVKVPWFLAWGRG